MQNQLQLQQQQQQQAQIVGIISPPVSLTSTISNAVTSITSSTVTTTTTTTCSTPSTTLATLNSSNNNTLTSSMTTSSSSTSSSATQIAAIAAIPTTTTSLSKVNESNNDKLNELTLNSNPIDTNTGQNQVSIINSNLSRTKTKINFSIFIQESNSFLINDKFCRVLCINDGSSTVIQIQNNAAIQTVLQALAKIYHKKQIPWYKCDLYFVHDYQVIID